MLAIAQVLKKTGLLYLLVFAELYKAVPPIDDAILGKPLLAGWTMDAKVYHRQWHITGNAAPLCPGRFFRNYLVEFNGVLWTTDFDGNLLHPASKQDRDNLSLKSSYSPVRLERAIRAFVGLEAWSSDFEDLKIRDESVRVEQN